MAEFYVEQQGWAHWPKVLIMCRKNGRDVTRRRYVPEVETGEGMGITDELRDCIRTANRSYEDVRNPCNDREILHIPEEELLAIADRIDAEHERVKQDHIDANNQMEQLCECSIKLPVDADGEPIHIGDVVEWCDSGETLEVVGIGDDCLFYLDGEEAEWTAARNKRHHHEPTVEDVLRDMHMELDEVTALYVGEAIDSDERDRDEARIFAEYAAKLRLAGDDA